MINNTNLKLLRRIRLWVIAFLLVVLACFLAEKLVIPWKRVSISGTDEHGRVEVEIWVFYRFDSPIIQGGGAPYEIKRISVKRDSGRWCTNDDSVNSFGIYNFPQFGISKIGLSFGSHHDVNPERFDGTINLPFDRSKSTKLYRSSPEDESLRDVNWSFNK